MIDTVEDPLSSKLGLDHALPSYGLLYVLALS